MTTSNNSAETTWYSLRTDHPDQGYDGVPGDASVSRWGEVGPESDGRWSWTIRATDDAGRTWDEDGGYAEDEDAAKRAVESWTACNERT